MTPPPQEDLLSTQLLRRGFLVETEGETIFLTDNAFLRTNAKRPETLFLEKKDHPRGVCLNRSQQALLGAKNGS